MSIIRNKRLGLDGSTFNMLIGTLAIPGISATYGDSLTTEWQSTMGSQERGEQSLGTYTVEDAKIIVSSLVDRTLLAPALAANGGGNVIVPIVMSYVHPDLGDDSDLLEGCRLIGRTTSPDNSAKIINVEYTFSIAQIRWTDKRITINKLDDVEQSTENGLGV